jgi:PPOX class probable F420-dependent enzyme
MSPSDAEMSKAAALLSDAVVVWLTTVGPGGQPQASPVWFVVEDEEFLVYSAPSRRLANIAANPRVALNLDSNDGEDVVTIEGTARVVDGPRNDAHPAYREKYLARIVEMGYTAAQFAAEYSVPIRITPTRWRVL